MVFGILLGSMMLIVIAGLVSGQAGGSGGPSPSDSPEAVVEQYLDTLHSLRSPGGQFDAEAATEELAPHLCSEIRIGRYDDLEERDAAVSRSEEEIALSDGDGLHLDFVVIDSAVYGEFAVVDVEVAAQEAFEAEATGLDGGGLVSVELVRENDTWLICDTTGSR